MMLQNTPQRSHNFIQICHATCCHANAAVTQHNNTGLHATLRHANVAVTQHNYTGLHATRRHANAAVTQQYNQQRTSYAKNFIQIKTRCA